jgi:hypothetical protein
MIFRFKIKEKQSSVVLLRNPFIFHLNKSESVTDLVKKGKKHLESFSTALTSHTAIPRPNLTRAAASAVANRRC